MDEFLRDAGLVLLGIIIGPMLFRLIAMPKRLRQLDREITRAKTDHATWAERDHRAMLAELSAVDEGMNARGIYHSGIRIDKRREVRQRHLDALEDDIRRMIRRIEDAGSFVGWPEKMYFKFIWPRLKKKPSSAENLLIDGAFRPDNTEFDDERAKVDPTQEKPT